MVGVAALVVLLLLVSLLDVTLNLSMVRTGNPRLAK
jgi:hypothetical protein